MQRRNEASKERRDFTAKRLQRESALIIEEHNRRSNEVKIINGALKELLRMRDDLRSARPSQSFLSSNSGVVRKRSARRNDSSISMLPSQDLIQLLQQLEDNKIKTKQAGAALQAML